jgi:hypothetical protein
MKQNKTSSSRRTIARPSDFDAVPKCAKPVAPVKPVASPVPKSVTAPAPKPAPKMITSTASTSVVKVDPEKKAKFQKTSPVSVPSILLEGNHTTTPAVGLPGHRYSQGPTPPAAHTASVEAVLPGSYGTQECVPSPFSGMERGKFFWFNVNAELIIYGANELDAKVTIGGRAIKLRPDGSFSFRFVLSDGDDVRCTALKFSRSTHYVGKHPQIRPSNRRSPAPFLD